MARAALTGALVGAIVGLSGVPDRLVKGLLGHQEVLWQVERLAVDAFPQV